MKLKDCCIKASLENEEVCPSCRQYLLQFYKYRQLKIKFKEKQK